MATLKITVNGVTDSVAGWAKRNGLSTTLIYSRLRNGYTEDEAVATSGYEMKKKVLKKLWHGRWVYRHTES